MCRMVDNDSLLTLDLISVNNINVLPYILFCYEGNYLLSPMPICRVDLAEGKKPTNFVRSTVKHF